MCFATEQAEISREKHARTVRSTADALTCADCDPVMACACDTVIGMEGMISTSKGHAIVCDQHPLFRQGLCHVLDTMGLVCSEADSFDQLFSMLSNSYNPDLFLFTLGRTDTADSACRNFLRIACVRSQFPRQPAVVVLEADDHSLTNHCVALGASACVSKVQTATLISEAIRKVLDGETRQPPCGWLKPDLAIPDLFASKLDSLNKRETRVLMMLCEGMPNRQIANVIGLSESGAGNVVAKVCRKLGVQNRTSAVTLITRVLAVPRGSRPVQNQTSCTSIHDRRFSEHNPVSDNTAIERSGPDMRVTRLPAADHDRLGSHTHRTVLR